MRIHLAWPVLATAMTLAAAFSVQAAADHDCAPAPMIAVADAPIADDPERPLDPSDPQFVDKAAQRYRAMERRAGAATATPPAAIAGFRP